MKVFVVVDIGCLECGESSNVLGIFFTEDEANEKASRREYFNRGQHSIEVFETEIHSANWLVRLKIEEQDIANKEKAQNG